MFNMINVVAFIFLTFNVVFAHSELEINGENLIPVKMALMFSRNMPNL